MAAGGGAVESKRTKNIFHFPFAISHFSFLEHKPPFWKEWEMVWGWSLNLKWKMENGLRYLWPQKHLQDTLLAGAFHSMQAPGKRILLADQAINIDGVFLQEIEGGLESATT